MACCSLVNYPNADMVENLRMFNNVSKEFTGELHNKKIRLWMQVRKLVDW